MDVSVYKALADFLTPIFVLAGGWLIKMLFDEIKDLHLEIKELDEKAQAIYAKKDDFREAIFDLKSMFNRIMDKLDSKVDK